MVQVPQSHIVRVYEAVAWIAPSSSRRHCWPSWDAESRGVAHLKREDLRAVLPPTELLAQAQVSAEDLIGSAVERLRDKVNKAALSVLADALYTTEVDALDLNSWERGLAAFMAQRPNGPRFAFVGRPEDCTALRSAIARAGGAALVKAAGLADDPLTNVPGYLGTWQGVEIYRADVPASAFVSCGPFGQWTGGVSLADGGQYQMGGGLGVAVDPAGIVGERVSDDEVELRVEVGAAITAQHNVRALVVKTA